MECLARGVIHDKYVDALKELLQSLCGSKLQEIQAHEFVLKSHPSVGPAENVVKLVCSLGEKPVWKLRHEGTPKRGAGVDNLTAVVRSVVNSAVSDNCFQFLHGVGFELDHELLRKGFAFEFSQGFAMRIAVTRIYRLPKLYAIDEAIPLVPSLHVVDFTANCSNDNYLKAVEAMVSFAEYLTPLVRFSKPTQPAGVVPTAPIAAKMLAPGKVVLEPKVEFGELV